ncbi:MAG TPA: hypothetical protein PLR71_10365, partial [Deltaproteobacteria bacterium]|nr:hypothetical protein [Deltaproteobacteria bacterium]
MKPRITLSPAVPAILTAALLLINQGCSSEDGGGTNTGTGDPLALSLPWVYSSMTSLTFTVSYEPDAEPHIGTLWDGTPYWCILQNNVGALLLGRGITVNVPWDLEDMDPIADQAEESWTGTEILALARSLHTASTSGSTGYIHVLFLNGSYEKDNVVIPEVTGLAFSGIPVLAIFKDAIFYPGHSPAIARFSEQATLVHEAGHVLGLVDIGLPMGSDHLDAGHTAQTPDASCSGRTKGRPISGTSCNRLSR